MTVGQAALEAGTAISEPIAEGVSQIVDKATNAVLEIVINGVRYAVVEFTDAIRYEMKNGLYWLSSADKITGKMFVSAITVSITIASNAMKLGISCYTPSFADAYEVAKQASDGLQPVHDEAHEVGYFNHYHRVNRKGVAHAFYGSPRAV